MQQNTEISKFYSLSRKNIEDMCLRLGKAESHTNTLFRNAYKKNINLPWLVDQLPKQFKDSFIPYKDSYLRIMSARISRYDQSVKFVIETRDQGQVESVLMPESKRITLCISSEIGCGQACAFCLTGKMGLKRSLLAGEMVGQIVLANKWMEENPEWTAKNSPNKQPRLSHVVYMGMGEPLNNVDEVTKAIYTLTDPYGPNLALSHISVSTAGHLEGMEKLKKYIPHVKLALSLHATQQRLRAQLMPITRKYPLDELLAWVESKYPVVTSSKKDALLIQYTLLSGINDSVDQAHELAQLLKNSHVKINLIPFNENWSSRFKSPNPEDVERFRDILHQAGYRVMVRYSKGQDIGAACGQLNLS